tara:strand:+ start:405 stop:614 length:210 start_codon:yes stop_codon:yes gene_type:complete
MAPSLGKVDAVLLRLPSFILTMSTKNSLTIFIVWITFTISFLIFPSLPAGILAIINLAFIAGSIWSQES